eukprot:13283419-Alexandrium_andersonii.AAC.1
MEQGPRSQAPWRAPAPAPPAPRGGETGAALGGSLRVELPGLLKAPLRGGEASPRAPDPGL